MLRWFNYSLTKIPPWISPTGATTPAKDKPSPKESQSSEPTPPSSGATSPCIAVSSMGDFLPTAPTSPVVPESHLHAEALKRKTEEELQGVVKRVKRTPVDDTSYEGKFQELCANVASSGDFASCWSTFTSYFKDNTFSYGPTAKIKISNAPFSSLAFKKEFFQKLHSGFSYDRLNFVRVFEHEDDEKSLIELSITPDGKIGELIWIQKGKSIKGCEVFKLYEKIANSLKIQHMYLFDDAQLSETYKTNKGTEKKHSVFLLLFYPLISSSARSFYEDKLGFKLVNRTVTAGCEDTTFCQKPKRFPKTVEFLKSTTLDKLFMLTTTPGRNLLRRTIKSYFPEKIKGTYAVESEMKEVTVGEMVQSIYQKSKEGSIKDLCNFSQMFFVPYTVTKPSDFEEKYLDELAIYTATRVYRKDS